MGIKVRMLGKVEFEARLDREKTEMRADVRSALDAIGMVGERESRRRAPFREGILMSSIVRELGETEQGHPCVAIKVPVNAPAAAYATAMHEDEYEPGKLSKKKEARTGVEVGRKYIERAMEAPESLEKFELIIRERLKR